MLRKRGRKSAGMGVLAIPDRAALEAEAAAWVARFDAGEVSAKDRAAFQTWLNSSMLHRQTIVEYGHFWSEFGQLGQLMHSMGTAKIGSAGDNPPPRTGGRRATV